MTRSAPTPRRGKAAKTVSTQPHYWRSGFDLLPDRTRGTFYLLHIYLGIVAGLLGLIRTPIVRTAGKSSRNSFEALGAERVGELADTGNVAARVD